MIEVVDLDLLRRFLSPRLHFRLVLRRFRFIVRIARLVALARYPVRYLATDERLKFTALGIHEVLLTRAVRARFEVARALSLLQFDLVHLVLLGEVSASRPFPAEATPELARLRSVWKARTFQVRACTTFASLSLSIICTTFLCVFYVYANIPSLSFTGKT